MWNDFSRSGDDIDVSGIDIDVSGDNDIDRPLEAPGRCQGIDFRDLGARVNTETRQVSALERIDPRPEGVAACSGQTGLGRDNVIANRLSNVSQGVFL